MNTISVYLTTKSSEVISLKTSELKPWDPVVKEIRPNRYVVESLDKSVIFDKDGREWRVFKSNGTIFWRKSSAIKLLNQLKNYPKVVAY